MTELTQAKFAERASYIASNCSQWAASCLTLPERLNEPMSVSAVERFLEEMQGRLDYLREDLEVLRRAAAIRAAAPPSLGSGRNLADANSETPTHDH